MRTRLLRESIAAKGWSAALWAVRNPCNPFPSFSRAGALSVRDYSGASFVAFRILAWSFLSRFARALRGRSASSFAGVSQAGFLWREVGRYVFIVRPWATTPDVD